MISYDLIARIDISTLDLIYGEMKNRMYQAQCAIDDSDEMDTAYYEGVLDAYGFVYTEIDRIKSMRDEK